MISTKECARSLRDAAFLSGVDIRKIYVDKIGPRNIYGRALPSRVRRVSAWIDSASDRKLQAMAGLMVDRGATDVRITRYAQSYFWPGAHIRCTARLG